MKHLFMILCLMGMVIQAAAQSAGTTSFEFLKSQYSARAAGMAGNFMAIKGDVNGMFYNPAGLANLSEKQWTLNYVDHLLDFQGGQLLYSQPNRLLGQIGVGLLYFNYGSFEETDIFGEKTGREFGAAEYALAVSIANTLGQGFDYGVNLKLVYSKIESYTAAALAVDAGLLYTIAQLDNLQVGVSVSNIGFAFDHYASEKEKLPLYIRLGFAKRLAHLPLLFTGALNDISLDTGEPLDRLKRFSLGGEFDISEILKLRLGYDNAVNQNVKPLGGSTFGGISAGLGVIWKKWRFDYAFASYGDLGSQNRLGITGSF